MGNQIFDAWPERYEAWFQTPIGALVKELELALVLEALAPRAGDQILDAGCGTGIFTEPMVATGARLIGLDISLDMLRPAVSRLPAQGFSAVSGTLLELPFPDGSFDHTVSVTALEFIEDGAGALAELLRVTRPGGRMVVATLNALSPWARRRAESAAADSRSLFNHTWFRSPDELMALVPLPGWWRTAVHFPKDAAVAAARRQEAEAGDSASGAFLLACWQKPA